MYKREWTKELERKAREEVNEVPEKKEQDVKHITDWLLSQPYLNPRTDREWILNYLRGCKFNVQKTKEKLKYLYATKPITPELYSNRDPLQPELQQILNKCIILPHSTKNEELMIVRWDDSDVSKLSLVNLFKLAFMFMELTLMESSSYLIYGYHLMIDFKGFPLSYVRQVSPLFVKKTVYMLVKAYPTRIKGIYLFNTSWFFPILFGMCKPFLSNKILQRVKIYDNFDLAELTKYVSIENVPKEYGGKSESVSDIGARWKLHIENHREWFLEEETTK
ncbi:hypothetical protein FQR65_LT09940 [Abscondita terminalis]|nr:hypothetical protein FQR65_LT09940 [Abscondita terminalis]